MPIWDPLTRDELKRQTRCAISPKNRCNRSLEQIGRFGKTPNKLSGAVYLIHEVNGTGDSVSERIASRTII